MMANQRIIVHDRSLIGRLLHKGSWHPSPQLGPFKSGKATVNHHFASERFSRAICVEWNTMLATPFGDWVTVHEIPTLASTVHLRWCEANCVGDWVLSRVDGMNPATGYMGSRYIIWFEEAEDSTLFTLTFAPFSEPLR